jgi:hypothetical protein
MFCPDSEAGLAVPPGMTACQPPPGAEHRIIPPDEGAPFDWTGWVDIGATEDGGAATFTSPSPGLISAADIARAFGVPANMVSPPVAADRVPSEELDRRLAEQLCYWCGSPLNHDDPVDMFCREDHAMAWRYRQTHKPDEVLRRSDYYGGDNPRPEPGETRPSWLGEPIHEELRAAEREAPRDPLPMRVSINEGERTPQRARSAGFEWTRRVIDDGDGVVLYDLPPMSNAWDWKTTDWRPAHRRDRAEVPSRYAIEPNRLRGDGITVASVAEVGQPNPGTIAIGYASMWRRGPALEQLREAPPLDRGGWPVGHLEYLQQTEGWQLACRTSLDDREADAFEVVNHCPLPMVRRCEHCTETKPVVIHTASFAIPYGEPDHGAIRVEVRRGSTLVCGGCFLPYTGPIFVPMWREHPDYSRMIELLLIARLGDRVVAQTHRLSREALEQMPLQGDLPGMVWGDMLRQVRQAASPWGCAAPHAPTPTYQGATPERVPAVHWVRLSADMRAWGYYLTPQDGEPLILGLCPVHLMEIHHALLTDQRMSARVQWGVVDGHALLVVA